MFIFLIFCFIRFKYITNCAKVFLQKFHWKYSYMYVYVKKKSCSSHRIRTTYNSIQHTAFVCVCFFSINKYIILINKLSNLLLFIASIRSIYQQVMTTQTRTPRRFPFNTNKVHIQVIRVLHVQIFNAIMLTSFPFRMLCRYWDIEDFLY